MKESLLKLKKVLFSPLGKRMSKEDRAQSRGVALLMVMISMILVAGIVADLGYDETVRYRLALNTSDSIKAEALAAGGLNWGRMLVVIQSKVQDLIVKLAETQASTLPAFTIWEMLPLDSEKIKVLTNGEVESIFFGRDMNEIRGERAKKKSEDQGEKKSTYSAPEGGFGSFDGRFNLEISDEESKISLQEFGSTTDIDKRNAIRTLLAALISPRRYDDIFQGANAFEDKVDRDSVIANIFDWLDADNLRIDPYEQDKRLWGRSGSGSEKDIYDNTPGVSPKNAYFDTLGELRLVHGVTNEFEQSFFDALTIYGQGGKINILSAKDQVVEALMRYCALNDESGSNANLFEKLDFADDMLKKWKSYPSGGGSMSVDGFVRFLKDNEIKVDEAACKKVVDVKSKTFTVTSKATVGDVTRTLTLVVGPPAQQKPTGTQPPQTPQTPQTPQAPVIDNQEEIYYFRNR